MSCTGRYAEAWEFVVFWFTGVVWTGADRSGGAGNASLNDTQVNFRERGVIANTGQTLWNLTQNMSGSIVAVVDNNTITATGVTWDDADLYRISLVTEIERGQIELALDIAATDVQAALAATGQCDCTWASWAATYAAKLNIIDAASYYQGKCGAIRFTNDQRANYLRWMSEQLNNIMLGRIDLCAGASGSDFPAVGYAQQVTTEFSRAEIIWNDIERNAGE